MKFNEMKYERPNIDEVGKEFLRLVDELKETTDKDTFLKIFEQINKMRNHVNTMYTLCFVRHSINTADEFYNTENDFWDETLPKYSEIENNLYQCCVSHPLRDALKDDIPETFFQLADCQIKSFSNGIIEDMIEENKLTSAYGKLKASAKIEFDGEVLNLAQISAKAESKDRDVRKRAYDAKMAFYQEHKEEFENIYDQLVKLRDKMAKKLGFDSYIELGYLRMQRLDYNADMVAVYRNEILRYVVPEVTKLYEKQRERLGFDELKYYDLGFTFEDGNPIPKGTSDDLINAAVNMYHELSPETGSFIDVMVENKLWDLLSKPNKQMGGYMTEIAEYHVPFIFSNFNGTSGDVDVLTHEAGHAFQNYMAKGIEIPDVVAPTMETCEIHSMSMEFFAYPWMKQFFGDDEKKYLYSHLTGTLKFLPYGVLVDHFQHEVYAHPEMTPSERNACWRKLEKEYMPFKNYDGCELLEEGCWWFQQGHIFESPFYYIDYTLAQVCAQQFYIRMKNNDPEYWNDYLQLCKLGGTKSFLQLLEAVHLKNPFTDGFMKDIVNQLDESIQKYEVELA